MAANLQALRARAPQSETLERYRRVAVLLTGNSNAAADAGVEWIRTLVNDLQIPALCAYGIKPKHVADLVMKATNASSMKANPIVLTPEELSETLSKAL